MRKTVAAGLLLATSPLAIPVAVQASETTTYTYDPLGRLVATSSSGTVNNGVASSVAYDPAGNRSSYTVSGAGGGSPPPPPPPPPPPANNPPVANADYLTVEAWSPGSINVVANDTDSDGDYPLSVQSLSDPASYAYIANSSTIGWNAAPAGTYTITYTVADSRGATATGTLTVTVTLSDPCGGQICQ